MNDRQMERLEVKLDRLDSRLDSIDVTLAAQHISLKEHMRRTALLEEAVEPVKKHVAMMHGALKLVGVLATSLGVMEVVIRLVKGH